MLALLLTIFIVGVILFFVNRAPFIVDWAKWAINAICVVGLLLYAARVLFGYHFPGLR